MTLKVVYAGQDARKRRTLRESEKDVVILLFDRWDDYDYKTTFPTECRIGGEAVELGSIQILFDNEMTSFAYLDSLVEQGWDGVFPVTEKTYISVPAALSFYEQIEGHLGLEEAVRVAKLLRDASYWTKIEDDPDAMRLLGTDGFRKSLQRERGATKAFLDGWKLFGREGITIGNQGFRFRTSSGELMNLDLRFASESPLPHDINVLIGPNGVGKSQLLHQIVEDWLQLDPDRADEVGFGERPNLNQVVVVSYSPFELFPVDTSEDSGRRDHNVYRYFGLRGRKKSLTDSKRGSGKVTLSREFPKTNAARSLLDCVADDQTYGAIKEWSNKVQTMERVLKRAIDFDYAAVAVNGEVDADDFFTTQRWLDDPFIDGPTSDEDREA